MKREYGRLVNLVDEYDYIVFPAGTSEMYRLCPGMDRFARDTDPGTLSILDKVVCVSSSSSDGVFYYRQALMDWIDMDMKYNEKRSRILFYYETKYEDAIREFAGEFASRELGEVCLYVPE
jgi:hypothetical protein